MLVYPCVVETPEVVPLLPGDHEGGKGGGVDGQKDDGEQGPDGGHKARSEGPRAVHIHWGLEEQGPHEPVRPEQRKLVVGPRGHLGKEKNLL